MDWLLKKWIIEDEEGELEFLSALFGTKTVLCTDEDVSTFSVINTAGDFYTVELVSIAENNFKKYYNFLSHLYTPQKLVKTDTGFETFDKAEIIFKDQFCKSSYDKKTGEDIFDLQNMLTGQDLFYFEPVTHECYHERTGMYVCIQTISNRFYVKVSDSPKSLSLNSNQEEDVPVKKRRGKEFSIKKTYTNPDETGRCTLDIELKCDNVVARISAYSHG